MRLESRTMSNGSRLLLMLAILQACVRIETRVANTILYMEAQINLTEHGETTVNVFRQWTRMCQSEMLWPFIAFGHESIVLDMYYDWSATHHTINLFCMGYDWKREPTNTIACPNFQWSPPVLYAPRQLYRTSDVSSACVSFLHNHPRLVGEYVHKYINTNANVAETELIALLNSTRTSVEMDGVVRVEFYANNAIQYESRLILPLNQMRCRVGFYYNKRQCVRCPANHTTMMGYTPESDALCFCTLGYGKVGKLQCMPCQTGFYSDTLDAPCRACAPGKFSNRKGQVFCEQCADGWIAVLPGSTVCTSCAFSMHSDANHIGCMSYNFQAVHVLVIYLSVIAGLTFVQLLRSAGLRCGCYLQ